MAQGSATTGSASSKDAALTAAVKAAKAYLWSAKTDYLLYHAIDLVLQSNKCINMDYSEFKTRGVIIN